MPFEFNVKNVYILLEKEKTLTDITYSTINSMKHSKDDSIFQTNLLQALQKNKVMQDKLTECQRLDYIQLLRDMQTYNVKEKYNRELLYTWKRESHIRDLRKQLQEYGQKHSGDKDAYYQYQLSKLSNIMTGQQSLVIPPSEEERRLNINVKYHQFLQKNPLQSAPMRANKLEQSDDDDDEEEEEEKNMRGVEETWKHIHAQSAVHPRRKQSGMLPNIHRSATRSEFRRKKSSGKSFSTPATAVPTNTEILSSPRLPTKSSSNQLEVSDSIEPLMMSSEILDKHTRADLITMRSVRRPRKNPTELNILFETRKRIYQINKRALDYQLYQRKCQLQPNLQFNQPKQIDPVKPVENVPENINDKHESERIII